MTVGGLGSSNKEEQVSHWPRFDSLEQILSLFVRAGEATYLILNMDPASRICVRQGIAYWCEAVRLGRRHASNPLWFMV